MADLTPPRAGEDTTLRGSTAEPSRSDYTPAPPDVLVQETHIYLKHNRFDVAVVTMVLTSLVTFFLPFFNGLLGGTFGGYHAGTYKRALGAAVVASVVVPATLFVLFEVFGLGAFRFYYGLGWAGFSVLHVIGTFIGAVAGAASRPLFSVDYPYAELASVTGPRVRRTRGARSDLPPASSTGSTTRVTETRAAPPSGPAREE